MSEAEVKIWLIGDTIPNLYHTKLPLALDVLKLLFHHQRIGHETIEGSAKKVAKELENIWNKTMIPTILYRNIVLKIESLKKKYEALKKSLFRRTEIQKQRELDFNSALCKMFDITTQVVSRISQEQKRFIEDQCGPRQLEISTNSFRKSIGN